MIFIQVIWKRLFTKKSAAEKGTLYQLKNLLNRTAVPLDPSDNMKAAEDSLLVVLHSHIVAAAKAVLDESEAIDDVLSLSKTIVENHITITLPSSSANKPSSVKCLDKVNMYATEVLTLGLLWHSFHDAIKEGMEIASLEIGSLTCLLSNQQGVKTIVSKPSICYSKLIIFSHQEKLLR